MDSIEILEHNLGSSKVGKIVVASFQNNEEGGSAYTGNQERVTFHSRL